MLHKITPRAQFRAGRLPFSEDDLTHMVAKVQRFKAILLDAFESEDAFDANEGRRQPAAA